MEVFPYQTSLHVIDFIEILLRGTASTPRLNPSYDPHIDRHSLPRPERIFMVEKGGFNKKMLTLSPSKFIKKYVTRHR